MNTKGFATDFISKTKIALLELDKRVGAESGR